MTCVDGFVYCDGPLCDRQLSTEDALAWTRAGDEDLCPGHSRRVQKGDRVRELVHGRVGVVVARTEQHHPILVAWPSSDPGLRRQYRDGELELVEPEGSEPAERADLTKERDARLRAWARVARTICGCVACAGRPDLVDSGPTSCLAPAVFGQLGREADDA